MTDLWRHISENDVFSFLFCRNSILICSTTWIMMKFSQKADFIKPKHLAKFGEINVENDGVMTSSKFRLDVKKWWRHISVKNDAIVFKLCRLHYYAIAIIFVKFHWFSFVRSWVIKIHLSKKRQIPMTSLTDEVYPIWF